VAAMTAVTVTAPPTTIAVTTPRNMTRGLGPRHKTCVILTNTRISDPALSRERRPDTAGVSEQPDREGNCLENTFLFLP
jgi:hypothetical protein